MTQDLVYDADGRLVIDVRGPRFGAAITSTVLGAALIVQGPVGIGLVAWQWLAFAVATFAGLAWSPYGRLFRFVKRRFDLGAPPATEPEGPPRFAQFCGFAVASVALVLFAVGATTAAWIGVGVVLTLSLLLALTGLCVGCELYLLGERLRSRAGARGDAVTLGAASEDHSSPNDHAGPQDPARANDRAGHVDHAGHADATTGPSADGGTT